MIRIPEQFLLFQGHSHALNEKNSWFKESGSPNSQLCLRLVPNLLSPSDLSVARDKVFVGCDLPQSHRPSGLELLRADADLGAESELESVRESRRHVHIDARGIDLVQELLRRLFVLSDNAVGMACVIAVDVFDRFIHGTDCLDREDEVQIFPAEIVFSSRLGKRKEFP